MPLFELTNEQRKCFALPPVQDSWERVEVKPSPNDRCYTYAYLDGRRIVKVIRVFDEPANELYHEYGVDEMLSEDLTKILPKTSKGKPQNFTTSNLGKRTPVGMALSYSHGYISIRNNTSDQCFYHSYYEGINVKLFADFEKWIDNWCSNTGDKELNDIISFASGIKVHRKFREGDFFRYRINRSLYGYGRILLDFEKMRKDGIEFWEIFMGKPLCVAVYHIATEDANMTPEQLVGRKMLPSQMIMDNIFYYGECEIIGNKPILPEEEDYPIHYGRSISWLDPDTVNYQCGRTFVTLKDEKLLYSGFINNGIGWNLDVELPILTECIRQDSNDPYWEMGGPYKTRIDMRNPKFSKELDEVRKQINDLQNK